MKLKDVCKFMIRVKDEEVAYQINNTPNRNLPLYLKANGLIEIGSLQLYCDQVQVDPNFIYELLKMEIKTSINEEVDQDRIKNMFIPDFSLAQQKAFVQALELLNNIMQKRAEELKLLQELKFLKEKSSEAVNKIDHLETLIRCSMDETQLLLSQLQEKMKI